MAVQREHVVDFSILDDVLLTPRERREQIRRALMTGTVATVGPAIEYAFQQPTFSYTLPDLAELPQTDVITALRSIVEVPPGSPRLTDSSLNPHRVEFALPRFGSGSAEDAGWFAFLKRLQGAARHAGFGKTTAAGFVGTVRELIDNVDSHSELRESGMVGYAWNNGAFECAVADGGIGILASLRKNPDYLGLSDHGDALQTALTNGESRFGRGTGHGLGFRQMFVALAGLNGTLRFRSGDHRLVIDGSSPSLSAATISQTVLYQGFMASLVCRTRV